MRALILFFLALAGPLAAQPVEFDPADFGKIVVQPRQSTGNGLSFEQAFGDYQNEPVIKYGENGPAVKMGRPIGRLDLLYKNGKPGFCTAFVVDSEHIVTNHHCIPGMDGDPTGRDSGVTAVQFVLGYINPGQSAGTDRYTVSTEIVETSRDLDYTVLKVFGDPSTKYGKMQLIPVDPGDGEFLHIIGHPQGQSQHISREGCAAASPSISPEGKLVHTCDTLGGNSGSPVLRITDNMVLGLHNAGNSQTGFNQAIPMSRILANSHVLVAAASPIIGGVVDPKPQPPKVDPVAQACMSLWTEAKTLGCVGYESYAEECGTHTFAGLARRYISQNCTAVVVDPKPEPKPLPTVSVLKVKSGGGGDYRDIASAVAAAKPGTRLEVYPGTYRTAINVEKPLEIVGVGERSRIVIDVKDNNSIRWAAPSGRISNLTIKQGGGTYSAVFFVNGSATMEDCDITSLGLSAVSVGKDSNPLVRRNIIHDGIQAGVLVFENGRGTYEDNDIYANTLSGVAVKEGADPIFRRNQLRDNKESGLFVVDEGKGLYEDNTIVRNGLSGISIGNRSDPIIRGNDVADNKESGIYVYDDSRGLVENNTISGNAYTGLVIRTGGNPVVRNNKVTKSGYQAIWVYEQGRGTYENNDLRGNTQAAFLIQDTAGKVIKRNNRE